MAGPTIQSLEDDAKAPLRDRAAHTGRSMEGKVRFILHARIGGSSGAILVARSKALREGVDGASRSAAPRRSKVARARRGSMILRDANIETSRVAEPQRRFRLSGVGALIAALLCAAARR
jgi:plasmid stability protein